MYSDEDGKLAVRFSRAVVEVAVKNEKLPDFDFPEHFNEESGAFVTINTYPKKELRGCIGYPLPYYPLVETLAKAAVGATQDPRFPKLGKDELDNIVVEVSILTPPEEIKVDKPMDYPGQIVIGRDGLIIKKGANSGLLLPQVPIEHNWDIQTFLSHTCMKAGLLPDAWLEEGVVIQKFGGEVFAEETPRGKISRKELHECA